MKKLLMIGLAGVLAVAMIGCSNTPEVTDPETPVVSVEHPDDNDGTKEAYNVSPTDDLADGETITIGDIMQFDGKYIHIISGDLVEVFEYDNSSEKDFYIGQTVQLTKGDNMNQLSTYDREDFTVSHTNMGHPIDQITGTITQVTEKNITVETADGQINIETYEPIEGLVGDKVTVYAMAFDKNYSAIMVLNENSKLSLTISTITRTEDGSMNLLLTDADGGEYTLNASHESMELDISQLTVGDVLTVYHKGIMESWPMQLDTILIRK